MLGSKDATPPGVGERWHVYLLHRKEIVPRLGRKLGGPDQDRLKSQRLLPVTDQHRFVHSLFHHHRLCLDIIQHLIKLPFVRYGKIPPTGSTRISIRTQIDFFIYKSSSVSNLEEMVSFSYALPGFPP